MPVPTIADAIAEFGHGLSFDRLPGVVVHEVKRRLIDSLGCALGAYDAIPAIIARAMAPAVKAGPDGCARIISNSATTPEAAAFANGVMVRYLDWNDTYLSLEPAHPSDNIPVALACAEAATRTGQELITAIVASYEVQCRLCDCAALRSHGFDHVTYGGFSATLAASMLLGLSVKETVHALGIAGAIAPALRQTRAGELSMWKGAAFANTGRDAVFAARLAKEGMTGPAPIFEGEFGVMKVLTGEFPPPDFSAARSGAYKIIETCIKYFPAEYHGQSAIAAAIEIANELEGDIDRIETIVISTFKAAYEIIGSGPERWRPATRETADHSLPFLVASALTDAGLNLASFSDERLHDGRLAGLIAKIKVVRDPALDKLYPQAMPNRVEARLSDGSSITREFIYPKGHPMNPLSDAEVEAKFKGLSAWRFAGSEMDRVLSMLWRLDELTDASEILRAFQTPART
ncbi:MAG: MmgE/PrpD family protein [Deltaproteobacteria bacterium]|nr:MmgE/PrpD family protein [Deltaproteobacteria bacterium]